MLVDDKEEDDEGIGSKKEMMEDDLKFQKLTSNLRKLLALYIPPKRILACKRFLNELTSCERFVFVGESGRTFYIKSLPDDPKCRSIVDRLKKAGIDFEKTKIKTLDFVDRVTKRPGPKKFNKTKPKIDPIYRLAVRILICSDMPGFLVLDPSYTV